MGVIFGDTGDPVIIESNRSDADGFSEINVTKCRSPAEN